jgi:hypothetical protein
VIRNAKDDNSAKLVEYVELMRQCSNANQADYVRKSVVQSLHRVHGTFNHGKPGYIKYLSLLDQLLIDDDAEIRDIASTVVCSALGFQVCTMYMDFYGN